MTLADGIARLTIRRAEKLNALDAAMVDSLIALCRRIEASSARVVILTGEGGKAFSAGGDIAAWSGWSPEAFGMHWVRDGHAAFDALARLRQPVIAVLNGHTLGGGLELAACADLRIAEAHVKLGQPETGPGHHSRLVGHAARRAPLRRAGGAADGAVRRGLYGGTGDLRLALSIRSSRPGEGLAAAEAVAARVMERGPQATALTKMLVNAAEGEERERVLEALAGQIAAASDELAEGLAAFREKRKPRFGKGETE